MSSALRWLFPTFFSHFRSLACLLAAVHFIEKFFIRKYVWIFFMRLLIMRPDIFLKFLMSFLYAHAQKSFSRVSQQGRLFMKMTLFNVSFSRAILFSFKKIYDHRPSSSFFASFNSHQRRLESSLDPIINFNKSLPQMAFHFYLRWFNSGQSHLKRSREI